MRALTLNSEDFNDIHINDIYTMDAMIMFLNKLELASPYTQCEVLIKNPAFDIFYNYATKQNEAYYYGILVATRKRLAVTWTPRIQPQLTLSKGG